MTATLSVAVRVIPVTANAVEVVGMVNVEIVGAVVSTVLGRDIAILADLYAEIFPAASLAQAYSVFEPDEVEVYVIGAVVVQPDAVAAGLVDDSFTK